MGNAESFFKIHTRRPADLLLKLSLTAMLVCGLAACSYLPREPFTEKEENVAIIPGIPHARFYADAPLSEVVRALGKDAVAKAASETGNFGILAISGGAMDGAFGAGVMNGWTTTGGRPKFTVVTGVSAGALIAPFAFLGPKYDARLKEAFTSGAAEPIGDGADSLLSLVGERHMRRDTLHDLIARYVDESVLAAIAAEHNRGRRLLVVTTNLDAQRAVVWNMGAIAASGQPYALPLFWDVLTASASIPGVFESTRITVSANGRLFDELHVDGGVTTNVFTLPEAMLANAGEKKYAPGRIYVLMNERLAPEFEVVESGLTTVVARSLETLIKAHSRTTVLASQEFAKTTGTDFNLTYIEKGFRPPMRPSFETSYMRAAFAYGYERAATGHLWRKTITVASRR